ncbi:MAG: hypothetical protein WCT20_03170 [Candidatus Babeliales bacterium]
MGEKISGYGRTVSRTLGMRSPEEDIEYYKQKLEAIKDDKAQGEGSEYYKSNQAKLKDAQDKVAAKKAVKTDLISKIGEREAGLFKASTDEYGKLSAGAIPEKSTTSEHFQTRGVLSKISDTAVEIATGVKPLKDSEFRANMQVLLAKDVKHYAAKESLIKNNVIADQKQETAKGIVSVLEATLKQPKLAQADKTTAIKKGVVELLKNGVFVPGKKYLDETGKEISGSEMARRYLDSVAGRVQAEVDIDYQKQQKSSANRAQATQKLIDSRIALAKNTAISTITSIQADIDKLKDQQKSATTASDRQQIDDKIKTLNLKIEQAKIAERKATLSAGKDVAKLKAAEESRQLSTDQKPQALAKTKESVSTKASDLWKRATSETAAQQDARRMMESLRFDETMQAALRAPGTRNAQIEKLSLDGETEGALIEQLKKIDEEQNAKFEVEKNKLEAAKPEELALLRYGASLGVEDPIKLKDDLLKAKNNDDAKGIMKAAGFSDKDQILVINQITKVKEEQKTAEENTSTARFMKGASELGARAIKAVIPETFEQKIAALDAREASLNSSLKMVDSDGKVFPLPEKNLKELGRLEPEGLVQALKVYEIEPKVYDDYASESLKIVQEKQKINREQLQDIDSKIATAKAQLKKQKTRVEEVKHIKEKTEASKTQITRSIGLGLGELIGKLDPRHQYTKDETEKLIAERDRLASQESKINEDSKAASNQRVAAAEAVVKVLRKNAGTEASLQGVTQAGKFGQEFTSTELAAAVKEMGKESEQAREVTLKEAKVLKAAEEKLAAVKAAKEKDDKRKMAESTAAILKQKIDAEADAVVKVAPQVITALSNSKSAVETAADTSKQNIDKGAGAVVEVAPQGTNAPSNAKPQEKQLENNEKSFTDKVINGVKNGIEVGASTLSHMLLSQ